MEHCSAWEKMQLDIKTSHVLSKLFQQVCKKNNTNEWKKGQRNITLIILRLLRYFDGNKGEFQFFVHECEIGKLASSIWGPKNFTITIIVKMNSMYLALYLPVFCEALCNR